MAKYMIIGAGGYGAFVSLEDVMLVMHDSRNPLQIIEMHYYSGKKIVITLSAPVQSADQYKLLNFFVDKILESEAPTPIATNRVPKAYESIGGSKDKNTGQYSSDIPFTTSKGAPILISTITTS